VLDLSYNNLTGPLPPVPPGLKELYLQGNRFQSGLSPNYSLGNNSLTTVDLSDNPSLGVSCCRVYKEYTTFDATNQRSNQLS
jgi:hypothetical protein